MKNKTTLLLLAGLLLAGCAQTSTNVTGSDEPVMTIGDVTYTKGDEYQLLKRVNGPNLTLSGAQRLIYAEEVGDGEEIQKQAEEMYNMYADTAEDFEEQIKSYGYKDKQDYMDNVIIPSVQSAELLKKYYAENKDVMMTEYKPTKAVIIGVDSEDNAKKALQALKDGEDPLMVANQYAMDGIEYNGSESVVTTEDTNLPTRLINALYEAKEPGILDEVFVNDTSTDTKVYYVAQLISQDYDELMEELMNMQSGNATINKECIVYYLTKYDFEVHDQFIFDYFKATNPEYLVTRPDLSE